uniref:Transmembrane protein n=1 Tax=Panagrolaimus sp. PS1159 TaxID=55785 RepID=A0AC35GM07_9BILA
MDLVSKFSFQVLIRVANLPVIGIAVNLPTESKIINNSKNKSIKDIVGPTKLLLSNELLQHKNFLSETLRLRVKRKGGIGGGGRGFSGARSASVGHTSSFSGGSSSSGGRVTSGGFLFLGSGVNGGTNGVYLIFIGLLLIILAIAVWWIVVPDKKQTTPQNKVVLHNNNNSSNITNIRISSAPPPSTSLRPKCNATVAPQQPSPSPPEYSKTRPQSALPLKIHSTPPPPYSSAQ